MQATSDVRHFEELFESELADFYKTDWADCPDAKKYKGLKMLVAVTSLPTFEWRLFVTQERRLSPVVNSCFIGDDDPLYFAVAKGFTRPALKTKQAVLIGLHVLSLADKTSNSVKGPFHVAVINRFGVHMETPGFVQYLIERLDDFAERTNALLLSIADPTTRFPVIDEQLEQLSDDARNLHQAHADLVSRPVIAVAAGTTGTFQAGTDGELPPLEIKTNMSHETRVFVFDRDADQWVERIPAYPPSP
jgi:hypothetical protein